MNFDHVLEGFYLLMSWKCILSILLGVNIGIIVGAIPGLTGSMAIALMIPLTFSMPPEIAITMLMGVYKGSMFGGSIPAILLNTPGMPASAPTALDGFALTRKGQGMKAMKVALYASFAGDVFSDLALLFLAAPLAAIAIKAAPPEYTAIIIFSMTVIGGVSGKSLPKGLLAAALGMFLACVGLDPIQGTPRLSFGFISLTGGFELIPMLIGLLAMSEIFQQMGEAAVMRKTGEHFTPPVLDKTQNNLTWEDFKRCAKPAFRSSVIGTILGALPGIGPSTASFLGYSEAKRLSKHPEEFGKGSIEGVAASEAANNATCGANIIPLLTLGIPGDVMAAVLVGALMLQGMRPGPMLMQEQPVVLYSVMLGLLVCDLTYRFFGTLYIRVAIKTTRIPRIFICPVVTALCIIGSFAVNSSIFDIFAMLFFGVLGWVLTKLEISLPALLIGFILEPMLEDAFRQTILLYGWDMTVFITRPGSLVILILTGLSIWSTVRRHRKAKAAALQNTERPADLKAAAVPE